MVNAVIFDLDGVITRTDEFHFLAWQKLAQEIGIKFTKKDNKKIRGVSRRESFIAIAGDKFTGDEIEEYISRKNGYYLQLVKDTEKLEPLQGIPELLSELNQAGFKTGLASASKNALTVLDKLQLEHTFDAVVDGNDLTKSKPDPQVFLLAAERLGVSPQRCIVLEDAHAGIDAAKTAGMYAIGIGESQLLIKGDIVVRTPAELNVRIIRSLTEGKSGRAYCL